jgi:hypothetical protein
MSNQLILYHGSEYEIKVPEYGRGSVHNDYGRGFYCTESLELAKEWACGNQRSGYANQYEFRMDGLNTLYLNGPEYSILNWLAVLSKHRTYWQNNSISAEAKNYLQEYFNIDLTPYDLIIGYRADDSYFSFAQDFVSGAISLKKLKEAMYLGKLGEQIVLKSPEAFSRIHFLKSEAAEAEIYYEKKLQRDLNARREYRRTKSESGDSIQELYMLDIMREGIKHGDPRLQ